MTPLRCAVAVLVVAWAAALVAAWVWSSAEAEAVPRQPAVGAEVPEDLPAPIAVVRRRTDPVPIPQTKVMASSVDRSAGV